MNFHSFRKFRRVQSWTYLICLTTSPILGIACVSSPCTLYHCLNVCLIQPSAGEIREVWSIATTWKPYLCAYNPKQGMTCRHSTVVLFTLPRHSSFGYDCLMSNYICGTVTSMALHTPLLFVSFLTSSSFFVLEEHPHSPCKYIPGQ